MNRLRRAVYSEPDRQFFYELRRLSEDKPWYGGQATEPGDHHRWFSRNIAHGRLWIWEEDGVPQATIRVESNGELTFDAHIGASVTEMLHTFLARYPGRYKVTLDEGDNRLAFLEWVGFKRYPAVFLCYRP